MCGCMKNKKKFTRGKKKLKFLVPGSKKSYPVPTPDQQVAQQVAPKV